MKVEIKSPSLCVLNEKFFLTVVVRNFLIREREYLIVSLSTPEFICHGSSLKTFKFNCEEYISSFCLQPLKIGNKEVIKIDLFTGSEYKGQEKHYVEVVI